MRISGLPISLATDVRRSSGMLVSIGQYARPLLTHARKQMSIIGSLCP